jgi:hypothetical protein
MTISIVPASPRHAARWCRMRCLLWPEGSHTSHRREIKAFFAGRSLDSVAVPIAENGPQTAQRSVELTIRSHAKGCVPGRIAYRAGWYVGVPSKGHRVQSVKVRPGLRDSSLVAWEAPWRESKAAKPSDKLLIWGNATHQVVTCSERRCSLVTRRPVAETVHNARRQQELTERSPLRQFSPAGYQRRHGAKDSVSTGETLGTRRRNLAEEVRPITVSGKWVRRYQGGGSGRTVPLMGVQQNAPGGKGPDRWVLC